MSALSPNTDRVVVRTVTVSLGATINTGNFESVRCDYSVTDSVREGELVNEAIDRVESVVEARLTKRMAEEHEAMEES